MIDISIIITTYNHEKYIEKAIESVLNQKGNFSKEIIIGDDLSSDKTREIICKYYKLNENIIRLLFYKKNIGITQNLKHCLKECRGRYIAICEGDDYWIDPLKLDKQMQFLEKSPECALCFNSIYLLYEETQECILHPSQQQLLDTKYYCTNDLIEENFIGNFSCCFYRNSVIKQLSDSIFELFVVDWMLNIACSEFGSIGFIKNPMSVYRIHKSGLWSGLNEVEKKITLLNYVISYDKYFCFKYYSEFKKVKKRLLKHILSENGFYKVMKNKNTLNIILSQLPLLVDIIFEDMKNFFMYKKYNNIKKRV